MVEEFIIYVNKHCPTEYFRFVNNIRNFSFSNIYANLHFNLKILREL